MHATYYFLTELDRTLDEGTIWCQAEDRIIDYAANHCDENNWWGLESIVLEDDHWAVREGTLRRNAGTWRRAWTEATWAVAFDFKRYLPSEYRAGLLPGIKADMTTRRETIAKMICLEIPDFLAWSYGQVPAPKPGAGDALNRYQRSSTATAYEMFMAPSQPDRYPFTDIIRSPYDYRAFDLCSADSANAIIRVDIHT